MHYSYLDWFKENFKIDQTSLVRTLSMNQSIQTIEKIHCPEYYVSNYQIVINTETEKDKLIEKHRQAIRREKEILLHHVNNDVKIDAENFFDSEKLVFIKECVQEIEIQEEIINFIISSLHPVFPNCAWYPLPDKKLFEILNLAKLPILKYGNSFWLGILPERINYKLQVDFFSLLEKHKVPDDSNLIITKLQTWVDIECSKDSLSQQIDDFEKRIDDDLKLKARQKVFASWEK